MSWYVLYSSGCFSPLSALDEAAKNVCPLTRVRFGNVPCHLSSAGLSKAIKWRARYHLHPGFCYTLMLHFTCHTTVQWPPALWLIKYPQECLRRQDESKKSWLSLLYSHQMCIYQHWKAAGKKERVGISHHLTSRLKFTLDCVWCHQQLGVLQSVGSVWLKIHHQIINFLFVCFDLFGLRGQRFGRVWIIAFADDYKS